MFVMGIGRMWDKDKKGPVSSIRMEALAGRESLESRYIDTSQQWRVTRLFSGMARVPVCLAGVGIVPHTVIEIDSKAGLTAKRSRKGGNSIPVILMLRDVRNVKERSFASKARPSRESDRMVDISPKSGGRSGKGPYAECVTSIVTEATTGE